MLTYEELRYKLREILRTIPRNLCKVGPLSVAYRQDVTKGKDYGQQYNVRTLLVAMIL